MVLIDTGGAPGDTQLSRAIRCISYGSVPIRGEGVRSWLSSVSTQEYIKFQPGRCGYSHFLDHEGHIIDDMIFAISSEEEVLGVPNSSMVGIVFDWLSSNLPEDESIKINDLSKETSIISLQGPRSGAVLETVLGKENRIRRFRCQEIADNKLGLTGWIQGTGYTGEEGVEIFISNEDATNLWEILISQQDVTPVGLGARDTLRLEKGYLLSGQDFRWSGFEKDNSSLPENYLTRSTIQTAVPYGLDMNHDFIGKRAMIDDTNSNSILWGLECIERGPSPRPGHMVLADEGEEDRAIGFVTSGGPSPSKGMLGIAMAYLSDYSEGDEVWIQTSKRKRIKSIVKKPVFV